MPVAEAIQPTHGKFVSCMTTIGVFTPKGASLNKGRPETRQINGSEVKTGIKPGFSIPQRYGVGWRPG